MAQGWPYLVLRICLVQSKVILGQSCLIRSMPILSSSPLLSFLSLYLSEISYTNLWSEHPSHHAGGSAIHFWVVFIPAHTSKPLPIPEFTEELSTPSSVEKPPPTYENATLAETYCPPNPGSLSVGNTKSLLWEDLQFVSGIGEFRMPPATFRVTQ